MELSDVIKNLIDTIEEKGHPNGQIYDLKIGR